MINALEEFLISNCMSGAEWSFIVGLSQEAQQRKVPGCALGISWPRRGFILDFKTPCEFPWSGPGKLHLEPLGVLLEWDRSRVA